jgi:hypothetical protein
MSIARKHGIEFNVLPDFSSAFLAHVQHLKDLGQNGKAAELKME